MKFPGKFFLALLLIVLTCLLVIYLLVQTRWGAVRLSSWISDNTEWHLSFSQAEHHFSSPSHLILKDVNLSHDNQPGRLIAKQVDLGLSLVQFSNPLHFDSIGLQEGEVNLARAHQLSLPVQSGRLQLKNMNVNSPDTRPAFTATEVSGGITPWKPEKDDIAGINAQFQASAGSVIMAGVPMNNVLIQGEQNHGQLQLTNLGANLARGALTGAASRDTGGNWTVSNLRLSDIRLQSSQSLHDLLRPLQNMPALHIHRLDLTNARLQGPEWAITDLNLTLKNLTWRDNDWQSENGSLAMNAGNYISGGFTLNDPILNMTFSPQGITLKQFSSHWVNGIIRASGHWERASKRLTLDPLIAGGLEYTLPQNWRDHWMATLPGWLNSVLVKKFSSSHNLIIDIDPAFPFQMTALDGSGTDVLLARDHQWGFWGGKLNFNAAEATFNRTDLRHPSMALNASEHQITISELSAFNGEGLLEGNATIGQQANRPVTLHLSGRNVPAQVLHNWGWPAVPIEGSSQQQLDLNASLEAGKTLRDSVNGTLTISNETQSLTQKMTAGQLR